MTNRLGSLLRFWQIAPLVLAANSVWAQPALAMPYEMDGHTLHLWHLDEAEAPFQDQAAPGTPLMGLLNGARAGQTPLPGFGGSVFFHTNIGGIPGASNFQGGVLLAKPGLAAGPSDNVSWDFRYFGEGGAFTHEMLIKLDVLPSGAPGNALDLISMDGDSDDRIFNFRIEKEGFLAFTPLPGSGSSGGAIGTIPTSGPDAIDTASWFHVAITYDGNEGAVNNVGLYWTKLRPGVLSANRIGSGTLSSDLNGKTGDLAIGNEARSFKGNAEAEPFPGWIDEVRISGVAREPTDFCFVPPEMRTPPAQKSAMVGNLAEPAGWKLALDSIFVDSAPVDLSQTSELQLGSGLHRLDIDYGFKQQEPPSPLAPKLEKAVGRVAMRCQLEGIDERWQEMDVGMNLVCQILNPAGQVVSQSRFPFIGRSMGWENSAEDAVMTRRVEPIFIPESGTRIKLTLTSGSPDTTGFLVIDYIGLHAQGHVGTSLWADGSFSYGAKTTSPAGSPPHWRRAGSDPAIARMILRSPSPGIGFVDGDQTRHGEWSAVQNLPASAGSSRTFSLSWYEAYNVIGGSTHRATYVNVPPGKYTFRVIGLAGETEEVSDTIALGINIESPFWQRSWFWPVLTAASVALLGVVILTIYRQRAKRSLERLRYQNAVEKDRARIARDMHDDLGSRVTFINMSATIAQRDLEHAPENARRHLSKMTASTRELIVAMDDLVWAVDPSHDTLDHLGSYLTRLAEEMFQDSPIRCRLDIPSLLPALSIGSELRHHVALAVKEAFSNVLRHAGPCEVFFSLKFDGTEIIVTVRDTGVGFDPATDERGHGLNNLASRFQEIGGTCKIVSSPGSGTCIVLACQVAAVRGASFQWQKNPTPSPSSKTTPRSAASSPKSFPRRRGD